MTYEELKQLVSKHCNLYYDLSAPEISDAEFDKLYDDLEAVEVAQGWASFDSPTAKIGGKAGKVSQPAKLYSLRKVYDAEEVDKNFDIRTPKIDGSNLTLVYRYGKLRLALTRGNGEMGDNVTHLAETLTNIPKYISSGLDFLVVNGECVTSNKVENFRNYVSGALGLKSAEEFTNRNILFIAHDVLLMPIDYRKRMGIIKNMGFTTVLDKDIESKYPCDGIVYRLDSYKKSQELGYTSKYPRFAVALKPRGINTAVTTLQDVVWVIGRTGTVNPTGIVDPVVLEDATISRVTLHNLSIIEEHNLGIGDTIEIERAGGVIPKFIKVVKHSRHNIKINQAHAEKAINAKTYKEGPKLFVADKSLNSSSKLVEHFVKTLEIKGLGPATIKKMNIQHPAEIFKIDDWSPMGANGSKIQDEVEKALHKPYELVLASLGIPGVGKSVAKLIVTKIPKFYNLADIGYVDIKGIGPSIRDSILMWLETNQEWVMDLPLQLEQVVTIDELLPSTTKKVCVTGKLDMSRKDLEEILTKKGYKISSTVTKDCYALITAGDNSSTKYVKAVDSGVPILDYWSRKKDILNGSF